MCGILGQILSQPTDKTDFLASLSQLNHRGPDDSGVYFDDNIALGQTRLSIVDLSEKGHQPMISECGNYVIVYNGEIYNFKEIKQDLISKKYKFNSLTDTEVILNGFIEYKEGILNKLNGMFAFCIYNKSTKEFFLARDRSGIKPLYYYDKDKRFVFSSELKPLKKYSHSANFDAKILFLLLGYIPEPVTMYKDVSVFPAGHYGYYKNGELRVVKYDDYLFERKISKPYKESVQDVSKLLNKSIKRHLISDAPIGVFLSGGLDSSIITSIASKYKKDLHTLSLVFDDKGFSEEPYQNLIIKKYNTKHSKCLINEQIFLDTIDDFFTSIDQPTIDGINTYLISQAAKNNGLKAVLSGIGADEIFYGYPSFKYAKRLDFLKKIPYSIINILTNSHKYKKLELLKIENELSFYLPTRGVFSPSQISSILNIKESKVYQVITNIWQTYNSEKIKNIEDKISYFELNLYMKNQLLRDADVFGMANSLEIRVPFLDKDLVDYVLRIEPQQKFGINNKIILVDAVKHLLPDLITNRPKMGFVLPFERWFKNNIHLFSIDNNFKKKFMNGQLHWSKIWALIILDKFDEKL
jgi:asparagine synthase (glutamine-hydrolysing)